MWPASGARPASGAQPTSGDCPPEVQNRGSRGLHSCHGLAHGGRMWDPAESGAATPAVPLAPCASWLLWPLRLAAPLAQPRCNSACPTSCLSSCGVELRIPGAHSHHLQSSVQTLRVPGRAALALRTPLTALETQGSPGRSTWLGHHREIYGHPMARRLLGSAVHWFFEPRPAWFPGVEIMFGKQSVF